MKMHTFLSQIRVIATIASEVPRESSYPGEGGDYVLMDV